MKLGSDYSDGILGYITVGVSPNGNTTTSDPGLHTGGNSDPTNTIAAASGAYESASAHDASELAAESSMAAVFSSAANAIFEENTAAPEPTAMRMKRAFATTV